MLSQLLSFNGPGNPNTIYQQASTNEEIPLPYDFLLWDYDGVPFTGVDIEMVDARRALLKQGNDVVGQVIINTPRGARGQSVAAKEPSYEINAPVSAVPTARLTAMFTTGDQPGLYSVTFSLRSFNSVTMFVTVDQTIAYSLVLIWAYIGIALKFPNVAKLAYTAWISVALILLLLAVGYYRKSNRRRRLKTA